MNKFTIDVPRGRIKEYERLSISHEMPDFLIPMSFVDYGDVYSVTYDYSGYIPVGSIDKCLTVRDIFDCLEGIIAAFRKAHLHLLFPDRLTLRKETVYVNREKRSVKLMFLPAEEGTVPAEELKNFLTELQGMYITKEAAEYTEMIKEYINENCGLRELQNRVIMIKREALLCGIQ